ncbi:MAG: winged helix DNA-binding protein [Blautia sp.]|nr:winged helix DNA-binding protein [Blautia sp.]
MEKPVEAIMRGGQFKQFSEQEMSELRKKYDLKRLELEVVYFLSICGGENTVVSIHAYLNANKGHISQTLFSLCEKGLVTSEQDKKDRRYIHYRLTSEGELIADQMKMVWDRLKGKMFEGISREEIEVFKRVSRKICENISRELK